MEDLERLPELERTLLDACLDIAFGSRGNDHREAVVGEARARSADVLGSARGPRRGADGSEPVDVLGRENADAGEPVLEGGVEGELAPALLGVGSDFGQLGAGGTDPGAAEVDRAPADLHGVEEEAVAGQLGVEPAA